nr:sensor histidine kinase [uncultured Schaedlerella sp.]
MKGAEILNTPGYYYALAYWISAFVIICIYHDKPRQIKHLAGDGAVFLILQVFMYLTDGVGKYLFIPSMLLIISLVLFYVRLNCGFTLKETGYYGAAVLINAEFGASLCWQIYHNFASDIPEDYQACWCVGEMILVYGLIYAGIYFLEQYLRKDIEELRISGRELLSVFVIVLMVYSVGNMSYVDPEWLFSSGMSRDIFIIRTLTDFCGICLLYAYHIQVHAMQMRFEMDNLQNIMEMQYKSYQMSQDNIDMVNQKYHDLKHQIALLKSEAETKKSMEYLEQMEREIKSYEAQNKTGNKVLDALLTIQSMACQSKGIELKCVADGELLFFIDDMDVSSLFGNMLDNAIESVEKLPEEQMRLIRLYVVREKQFLRICMENYCMEQVQFKKGMPVTTKKDKRLHGFGMKSIQSTVKKYDGSMMASLNSNWFEVRILIPIP